MNWKKLIPLSALALAVALLAGCSREEEAKPLPESMDTETVMAAGEAVLNQLLDGDYQAVYDQFRSDIQADLTVEDIQELVEPVFTDAGTYESIQTSDAVGSSEDEEHGIARFLCVFSQEEVLFNAAFDPDMELIGLSTGFYTSDWTLSNLVDNIKGMFSGD